MPIRGAGSCRGAAGLRPSPGSLERYREDGATFAFFRPDARWWIECYPEFDDYLREHSSVAFEEDGGCAIYDLRSRRAASRVPFD